MGTQPRRELASVTAARSVAATIARVLFALRAAHWLRRLLPHGTVIGRAKPTIETEHAIITYADARAIRRRVLVLLCQWFDVVVEIIGFFKNDSVLKNHVISIRYNSYDSVVLGLGLRLRGSLTCADRIHSGRSGAACQKRGVRGACLTR